MPGTLEPLKLSRVCRKRYSNHWQFIRALPVAPVATLCHRSRKRRWTDTHTENSRKKRLFSNLSHSLIIGALVVGARPRKRLAMGWANSSKINPSHDPSHGCYECAASSREREHVRAGPGGQRWRKLFNRKVFHPYRRRSGKSRIYLSLLVLLLPLRVQMKFKASIGIDEDDDDDDDGDGVRMVTHCKGKHGS